MKNNIDLVKYAEKALNQRWGYVWGTFGQILTSSLLAQKKKQYPSGVGNYERYIRSNYMGKKVADCVGLIKSYVWYDEKSKKIKYNSSQDITADMMYQRASKKGSINTIDKNKVGRCVWFKGHIGVYIGNGYVIEARGTKFGVVKTRLNSRPWTHWLECPFISYSKKLEEKEEEGGYVVKNQNININGKDKSYKTIVQNGRTFVELRKFAEDMNNEVYYNDKTTKVSIKLSEVEVVHKDKIIELERFKLNDLNYVEMRKVLESLGHKVKYDEKDKRIYVD